MELKVIQQAVLQGIENAQALYEKWSGGDWLVDGPEYMATIEIARQLIEVGVLYVTPEYSALDTLEAAGLRGPGKIKSAMRHTGRFDLVLWKSEGEGEDEYPFGCIEVKIETALSKLEGDVDRIMALLDRKPEASPIEFGMLGFFFWVQPKTKIEVSLKELEATLEEWAGQDYKLTFSPGATHSDPEIGDWAAVCITFERT